MRTAVSTPPIAEMFSDAESPRERALRKQEFIDAMTESTIAGLTGETVWDTSPNSSGIGNQVPTVMRDLSRSGVAAKGKADYTLRKAEQGASGAWGSLEKEWTTTSPVSTGLVPYDLEAPAKLLTPRPTPFRNSIPRVKGQGSARRFKVISGCKPHCRVIGKCKPRELLERPAKCSRHNVTGNGERDGMKSEQ